MDNTKLSYFLDKYRSLGSYEFSEMVTRNDLSDEAISALQQVAKERSLTIPDIPDEATRETKELSEPERAEQTKLSTDLWNSPISKRVQLQFGLLAFVFSSSLLGSQGLRVGALWLLLLAVVLCYFASKMGRQYTRSVCADGNKTIDEKHKALRNTSLWLWPAMLIPAFAGVLLVGAMRAA